MSGERREREATGEGHGLGEDLGVECKGGSEVDLDAEVEVGVTAKGSGRKVDLDVEVEVGGGRKVDLYADGGGG